MDFFIKGEPVPQGRPRFRRFNTKEKGEFVSTYDPKESRGWKKQIATQALAAGVTKMEGALHMTIRFFLTRPKSVSEKKRPWPIVKPDLDNLEKAVKDALKGIAYADDSQVCRVEKSKEYGREPGVWVGISELV